MRIYDFSQSYKQTFKKKTHIPQLPDTQTTKSNLSKVINNTSKNKPIDESIEEVQGGLFSNTRLKLSKNSLLKGIKSNNIKFVIK